MCEIKRTLFRMNKKESLKYFSLIVIYTITHTYVPPRGPQLKFTTKNCAKKRWVRKERRQREVKGKKGTRK